MNSRIGRLLVFAVAVACLPLPAVARCLRYEPATVSLVGELSSKLVPGPPSYTSLARGDIPETIFILHLAEPVCVSGDPASQRNSESHTGISEVQLSVPQERVRALVGKKVRASGNLFSAQTGHHRTPVVLRVTKVNPA